MAFELKYLFECHFKDGTYLLQTKEDLSRSDPTRSAFYDVAQRLSDVIVFGIMNATDVYIVDLRDGHFEINGSSFQAHPTDFLGDDTTEYRLIYFRQHSHRCSISEDSSEELDHTVAYHLGWQTTIAGKNYQQTISVT